MIRRARCSRSTAVAAAFSLLVLFAVPAESYRMIKSTSTGRVTSGSAVACNHSGGFAHWTNANISWRLNTAGQGSGKATAIQNALASWKNVTNANHNPTYAGTTSSGWTTDGQNTVLWATGNGCTGTCLALTALVLQSGQVIVESDITFNNSKTWTTNGGTYDTEAVAAHEFGHSLGIHHTDLTSTPRPTMYASYFGSGGRSLHNDDQAALQCAESKYPFVPPTPGFLEVISLQCYGEVNLDWTSSSGATSYQVQMSSYSNFSSPTLIYNGPNTYYEANITGIKYFRVKACSASGCSGYRNGDDWAEYYDGCI